MAGYPARPEGIAYGGDYYPEQWPREVQEEDIRLMREAGVTLVSLGIFAWALLEPAEGRYEFGWLDEILDRLHAAGIAVDLGTPTAAPPAWFSRKYPDSLPVTREGVRVGTGGREHACSSHPAFRRATVELVGRLAARYGEHPAVVMWHVHNEYGAPLGECYCEASVTAWREWLRQRYAGLDALNDAWGTLFWGQRYGDWAEIDAPRWSHTVVNPAQRLDYARFSNDEHLAHYRLQKELLGGKPVTTNFAGTVNCKSMDLWTWAGELDVIANDHYLDGERPDNHIQLAMSADLSRSLGGGAPWMIMEHSTGAVSWQPRGIAKRPGEMRRNSLAHVARGSDAVMFFQWRASRFGAEKFHSAMVPHAGTDSAVWRDVVALGADLRTLGEVRGTRVTAEVAIVWDWVAYWALELEWRPSGDLAFLERMSAYYEALWRDHVTTDFLPPSADISDFSRYRVVVLPSSYLLTEAAAKNLQRYVEGGGTLVVSYFSGIVNEHDTMHPGAYPGVLRDVLGLTIEEFHPLRERESVTLSAGGAARVWSERVRLTGARSDQTFSSGPDTGHPAVTRNDLGAGTAWYVATAPADLRPLLTRIVDQAGVTRPRDLPETLELVRRDRYVFLINHADIPATVPDVTGLDLLAGTPFTGQVPAGGVTVVRIPL
ncbi:beta-galactosidase [Acrocarpospora catenulata]|uniref:beta-galactosidase n=1 Tax=Acrocarpospora catenulata TaxID=2836182 RepID=UPI0027E00939|nr:beta-galactosidase [Acrocarpospora catenulata]